MNNYTENKESFKSLESQTNKIFFPNLDGLRFIAFFSVFLFHSGHTEYNHILNDTFYKIVNYKILALGALGVNFFFVLSGFLITYLLCHEEMINGKINLKSFYVRRTLRIWPLYFGCVLFGFLIFPILKTIFGQEPNETANLLLFLGFLGNFNNIAYGLPDSSVLGVLWSVGIEEQFYLFWPIMFIVLNRDRKVIMFLIVIVFSVIFRF